MAFLGRRSGRAALIHADIPSNLNLLGEYVKIPSATTTERDALTPAVGMLLYNTTLGIMQQYASSGWASIDSPPTVSSLNYPGDDTALDVVGEYNDATCDYNNDPTITHDTNSNMKVGMSVTGTGIPVGATIASVTSTTAFELSASTTGGAVTNGTLTFNTQTLVITGTNFQTGLTVTIDGTAPSTVTRDSSTQITVTGTPAKTVGTKVDGLVVTNTSGLAASINVDYSPLPGWTTASGNVGNFFITGSAITEIDLVGGADTTSYALTNSLPPGLAMNTTTGNITGTITGSTYTTYNFTVDAIDAQAQSSPRLFNIITNSLPTGGIITTPTGFRVHKYIVGMSEAFTFIPASNLTVEYLVIAGGASGARWHGAGGGAGGYRAATGLSLVGGTTYTIAVGAGGAGQASSASYGNDGNDSSISGSGLTTITSTGGGGGGYYGDPTGTAGRPGGSGGGAGPSGTSGSGAGGAGINDSGTFGTATYQGHDGGDGAALNVAGAGGGGAGAVGADFVGGSSNGGNGGIGVVNNITGADVTYAGGGGGASWGGTIGIGGSSIGGNGADDGNNDATAGAVNTGSGGGGASNDPGVVSGAGGSGIVIITYAV